MLRALQRLLLPFLLATAGLLVLAGAANAHAEHGASGSTRVAATHSGHHDAVRHDAAQQDETRVPTEHYLQTTASEATNEAPAGAASVSATAPCDDNHGTAHGMDGCCCAVSCHSAVGAALVPALSGLTIVRTVPAAIGPALEGRGTDGTERPPRLS